MHRFLYCKKIKKNLTFSFVKRKRQDYFKRMISENIKMYEHNSKCQRMDWDAKYLPLAFKSFKEHCNLCLEVR